MFPPVYARVRDVVGNLLKRAVLQDDGGHRRNQKEDTLKWLQAAYDDHAVWMGYLAVDPIFDRYRSDQRFQEFLERLRLP